MKILVAPRKFDQSKLNPGLVDTSHHQAQDLEGPNTVMVVPDTPYLDLLDAVRGGDEATHFLRVRTSLAFYFMAR